MKCQLSVEQLIIPIQLIDCRWVIFYFVLFIKQDFDTDNVCSYLPIVFVVNGISTGELLRKNNKHLLKDRVDGHPF